MNEIVSNLLVYGSLPEDSILWQLADICEKLKNQTESKDALRGRVFHQVKNLLTVATDYAFDKNLWHNYLTFLLITNENPFSLVCEKMGAQDGTVNNFVTHDFEMFKKLFDYDFSWMEKELSIDCFTQLTHYKAIRKKELMYNKNVSEKVRNLSEQLETAESGADFFKYVTEFYKDFGVGMFGLNKAFRIAENGDGSVRFLPINNMDAVMLDDLIGYELQKKKLVENTQAFCDGKSANNVLLFGDSGTGKSTSIKAIVNQFYPQGLRMIEIYKHQFKDLSTIIAQIKNRNYKFIIYMDQGDMEGQRGYGAQRRSAPFRHYGRKTLPGQPFWTFHLLCEAEQGRLQRDGDRTCETCRHHSGYHDGRGDLLRGEPLRDARRRTFRPYCPAVCELPAHDQIRILTEYEALVWRHAGAFFV